MNVSYFTNLWRQHIVSFVLSEMVFSKSGWGRESHYSTMSYFCVSNIFWAPTPKEGATSCVWRSTTGRHGFIRRTFFGVSIIYIFFRLLKVNQLVRVISCPDFCQSSIFVRQRCSNSRQCQKTEGWQACSRRTFGFRLWILRVLWWRWAGSRTTQSQRYPTKESGSEEDI